MPTGHKSPYDRQWQALRRRVLLEEGYRCYEEGCTNRATTGDHIIPLDEAPHLRLVRSNVRASCPKHNFGRVVTRASAILRLNQARGTLRAW